MCQKFPELRKHKHSFSDKSSLGKYSLIFLLQLAGRDSLFNSIETLEKKSGKGVISYEYFFRFPENHIGS